MKIFSIHSRMLISLMLAALSLSAHAQNAAALLTRHAELLPALNNNIFQRPLYLESHEDKDRLRGDVYAVIARPYALAATALQRPEAWCQILMLHPNVKGCRSRAGQDDKDGALLQVNLGRKSEQALKAAHLFAFHFALGAKQPNYTQALLSAAEGPLGTSQYRILLEVTNLDTQRSFLHLSYSYAAGATANLAVRGYLATLGRDKVGFTVTGQQSDGSPQYIGGKRALIERNTLRYYLAIEAYLGALSMPKEQQLARRLNDWFDNSERYPLQLHEMERAEYLGMKQREFARQLAEPSS